MNAGQRIAEALDVLGIPVGTLPMNLPYAAKVSALERWKDDVLRPRWKELARELHPDRGGSTEAMARVNDARDVLEQLEVVRPRPIAHQVQWTWGSSDATTTSTWRR